jgi:hypothetical protein
MLEPQLGHPDSLCSLPQIVQYYFIDDYPLYVEDEADDNNLKNPFISISCSEVYDRKAPSATSKDIGNGRTKAIATLIAMCLPIHF